MKNGETYSLSTPQNSLQNQSFEHLSYFAIFSATLKRFELRDISKERTHSALQVAMWIGSHLY
jgi:hypothetical protein